jgi:hypothetical protein
MTNRRTPTLAVAFALISCWLGSATVQAWGPEGHRIIGRIAEAHLTPQAQAGVNDLLNPLNSTSQLSRLSEEQISCWADWIRHDWTNSAPWHFVDIPYNAARYDPISDCANRNGCVVEAIHTFSKVLADKHAAREQRLEALKFVVHFVGDIHQPLHCAERNGDKGGNFRMVTFPGRPDPVSLHYVWDSLLLEKILSDRRADALEYADQLNVQITKPQEVYWKRSAVEDWATESHKLAVQFAYATVPANGPPAALSDAYIRKNEEIVDVQLMRAGVRLAAILNEMFK